VTPSGKFFQNLEEFLKPRDVKFPRRAQPVSEIERRSISNDIFVSRIKRLYPLNSIISAEQFARLIELRSTGNSDFLLIPPNWPDLAQRSETKTM